MSKEEQMKILKDSGVSIVGNGLIELEETEIYGGTTRYKKTMLMEIYIEKLLDDYAKNLVMKKFEDKFKEDKEKKNEKN